MADTYVDLTGAGSATSPYDTWAKATSSVQTGLTQAGAGGRCFVKTNSSATNKDTAAAARTLTSPGTATNITQLIGVKSTTTAEPPTDSDLLVRGTDSLPMFEATGGNNIALAGACKVSTTRIDAGGRITQSAATSTWLFEDSELDWTGLFFLSTSGASIYAKNCDFVFGSTSSYFLPRAGTFFNISGGVFSGSAATRIIDNSPAGLFTAKGVDMSAMGATFVDLANAADFIAKFSNCKTPASFSVAAGAPNSFTSYAEAIGCIDTTGLASGASIRDYLKESSAGTTQSETTAVRTGGSDDGASGGFSYALTPNVNATNEAALAVESPMLSGWVAGDGTTSFTVTAFIANSGAADYNTDDVRLELFSPSSAGDATHEFDVAGDVISGSSTAITDDTASTWGTGAANAQKLSVTITPDFEGEIYGRILFSKRFASSPETLYVDGKLDIA